MSTVKISELPIIPRLNQDTTQTLLPAVDVVSGVTGRLTTRTLAESLYANDVLNVGNNEIIFPGVIAQFVGEDESYLQINMQNLSNTGSGDMVITADDGTDETYFIDMGIQGSNAPLGTLLPHDGYLVVQGDGANTTGNLIIGTVSAAPDIQLRFVAGGLEEDNVYAVFETTQSHFLNNVIVDGTLTGTTITEMNNYTGIVYNTANAAFVSSNLVGSYANSAYTKANNVGNYANGAFTQANTNSESISSINLTLLNTQNYANGAYIRANNAGAFANGAFDKANNALANTSGAVFDGDLTVSGNLQINYATHIHKPDMPGNGIFLLVTGSSSGAYGTPSNPGYTIQTVSPDNEGNRIVAEAYANVASGYAGFIARRARGTADSPLPIQSGDIIARFAGNAYGDTKFSQFGDGRIEIVATGTHTDTSKPTEINFLATAVGTNTATQIAHFNGNTATFVGFVTPSKGIVYTPRLPAGNQTTITIDYTTDSIIKANCVDNLVISHTNFVSGKIVEVWLVNTDTQNHTVTHGCSAMNSTNKSTTATITSGSSMFMKFFSINGDQANTFVSING